MAAALLRIAGQPHPDVFEQWVVHGPVYRRAVSERRTGTLKQVLQARRPGPYGLGCPFEDVPQPQQK